MACPSDIGVTRQAALPALFRTKHRRDESYLPWIPVGSSKRDSVDMTRQTAWFSKGSSSCRCSIEPSLGFLSLSEVNRIL